MGKDLFSNQAELYAKYRPSYPKELIEYIVSFVNKKEMALDCATGNGQAAVLLAPFFQKVFAIDTSLKQISQAVNFKGITYLRGEAEKTSFDDNSFDLITVAQAYHWFEFDAFSAEATRIAKPGAIIAVWGYGLVTSTDRALENAISNFYTRVVGKFWDSERRYIDQGYTTIPFAFNELPSQKFKIQTQWKAEDLIGYLNTWSSVQHFIKANHYNPVDKFFQELSSIWNDGAEKSFSFPLFLRTGRIEK
jgi:ubiquinone/menaquinone biosynthesis C-methylase UbiE